MLPKRKSRFVIDLVHFVSTSLDVFVFPNATRRQWNLLQWFLVSPFASEGKIDEGKEFMIAEVRLCWRSTVKINHKGPTSLAFMPLIPGTDQVVSHICIQCIVRAFKDFPWGNGIYMYTLVGAQYTGHLIGCGKKWKITRKFSAILCGRKWWLSGKDTRLCGNF